MLVRYRKFIQLVYIILKTMQSWDFSNIVRLYNVGFLEHTEWAAFWKLCSHGIFQTLSDCVAESVLFCIFHTMQCEIFQTQSKLLRRFFETCRIAFWHTFLTLFFKKFVFIFCHFCESIISSVRASRTTVTWNVPILGNFMCFLMIGEVLVIQFW